MTEKPDLNMFNVLQYAINEATKGNWNGLIAFALVLVGVTLFFGAIVWLADRT